MATDFIFSFVLIDVRNVEAARVDIDEQRRKDIEKYKRLGAIKKKLHLLPEFERDLKGPKLPEHALEPPITKPG